MGFPRQHSARQYAEIARKGVWGRLIGVEIQLVYTPDGRTDGDGNAIEPHVDGDALINRIEKSDPDYNWNRMRRPENRPFFRNFVEEMIEGQRAENTLVAAMNAANPTLGLAADGNIIRENEDWR